MDSLFIEEIKMIFSKDSMLPIFILSTYILLILYKLILKKINSTMRLHELELKNAMLKNMNSDNEDTVKEAITRIPEGVNEDEFFDRLKKNCWKLVIFS